jgi:hypothetical protein
MSTARDTPEQRVETYRRLFESALLRCERRDDGVVFAFHAGARETVEDLARREAACCPFLDYRVDLVGDELIWTIGNAAEHGSAYVVLDAFFALPGDAGAQLRAQTR